MNIAVALTYARLLMAPLIVVSVLFWSNYLTLTILAVALLTDVLDGFFARRMNTVTKKGAILDSIADKVIIGSTVVALFVKYEISLLDLFFILTRDIVIGFGALVLFLFADWKKFDVHSKYSGKIVTFFQGLTIFLLLIKFKYVPLFIWFVFILGLICVVDYFLVQKKAIKSIILH